VLALAFVFFACVLLRRIRRNEYQMMGHSKINKDRLDLLPFFCARGRSGKVEECTSEAPLTLNHLIRKVAALCFVAWLH
jgi:hypothetical protein